MNWFKKLFGKKEVEFVKEELEPVVVEEKPAAPPAEIVREKQFVVNCPRCGAAVKVSGSAPAYLCGGCRQIFRVRIEAKMVKDLSAQDLQELENPTPVEEMPAPVVEEPVAVETPVEVEVKEDAIPEENSEVVEA